MVRDAYYFLSPALFVSILFFSLGWPLIGLFFLFLGAFVAFFFRDPRRTVTADPRAILSPADGKVVRVEASETGTLVSIFLSIFDVHVNRAPIQGKVTRLDYCPGKFLLAFDEKASAQNEQLVWTIEGERRISFSLIAGFVARRIVAWKRKGEFVGQGDKIGLIRFGSRVDISLPESASVRVKEGDRVRGGCTVIGRWRLEPAGAGSQGLGVEEATE